MTSTISFRTPDPVPLPAHQNFESSAADLKPNHSVTRQYHHACLVYQKSRLYPPQWDLGPASQEQLRFCLAQRCAEELVGPIERHREEQRPRHLHHLERQSQTYRCRWSFAPALDWLSGSRAGSSRQTQRFEFISWKLSIHWLFSHA